MLAVGMLGSRSRIRDRIAYLLSTSYRRGPKASVNYLAASGMGLIVLTMIATLAPRWIAFAQQTSQIRPEVVSVKPNTSREPPLGDFAPNGTIRIRNTPLLMILSNAYNIPFQSSRLTGISAETASLRYDIEATAAPGAFPSGLSKRDTAERIRSLLQTVLIDRFHLSIRRETKVMPVYAITVAKGGPKLERAKITETECPDVIGPFAASAANRCHDFLGGLGRGLHGQAVSMEDLAQAVSNWADRPVIDKSGLDGLYKIETKPWRSMRLGPAPPAGAKAEDGSELADLPTLFGVFEELGLKLDPQRAPVETFVIDHIEKPDAN
jgi:uncharacterized protein (TIGR03435 family)